MAKKKKRENAAPAEEVVVVKADNFRIVGDLVTAVNRSDERTRIDHVIAQELGSHFRSESKGQYDLNTIARIWPSMKSFYERHDWNTDALFIAISEIIEPRLAAIRAAFEENLSRGKLEFIDLPLYFEAGSKVGIRDKDGSIKHAGKVINANIHRSQFGNYLSVVFECAHLLTGVLQTYNDSTMIGEYSGVVDIERFHIGKLSPEDEARLSARGARFRVLSQGSTYMGYTGQVSQASWFGAKHARADGRIIIDPRTFSRLQADLFSSQLRAVHSSHEYNDDVTVDELNAKPVEINDEDLYRIYPKALGFSLRAKQWGSFDIESIRPISWRDDAFDKLVMDGEEKELVRAIVEHSDGSFSDIVEGKGGGSIFLLHGPPGEGKTLTAEAVAEVLKRPLYAVSVGELGTNPESLEDKLREILDVAIVWNAVLLLDEADIFLEARDEHNIVRNAMVGVFLRLLEYHQGVLFLTTNRVKNLDQAFYSRVSMGLNFPKGTAEKRASIWKNLLTSAQITGIDAAALSVFEINGRQIKNTIRLAQTLARAKGHSVTAADLERVIKITKRFAQETNEKTAQGSGGKSGGLPRGKKQKKSQRGAADIVGIAPR